MIANAKEIYDMKNNTSKKPNTDKSVATPVANCSRTSNFVAHRCGKSEKRLSTHLPLLLFIPLAIALIVEPLRNMLMRISGAVATAIESLLTSLNVELAVNPVVVLVAFVLLVSLVIICWWNSLKSKEAERCNKAAENRYYFYDDIIELCTKDKREQWRTLNGIVSVKVTPAINKSFGPTFMTVLVALLSLNSKPLWQRKYGFRDVTIVTLGSPSETIVLHDVEDPSTLVNNIKRYYPQCNVESFGNGFNL